MWVIAHRGASGAAPENTMAAFQLAADAGATFVETDLQLSRDARLVAIHDATVDRTTDGKGPVAAKTLEELRSLDAGAWFRAAKQHGKGAKVKKAPAMFAGERVPTIEEILKFGRERDLGLYLEIKAPGASGAEHAVVGAVRAANEVGRTVILSFDPGMISRVRKYEPLLMTGLLYEERIADPVKKAVELGARQLLPEAGLITPELVKEAHRADLKLVTWTVNDPKQMARLIDADVDGIITDYPAELIALLRLRRDKVG